jgi:superfamily II DNA or RNA helicase
VTLRLRDYQADVVARARGRMQTAGRHGIIQGETGSGKTLVGAELCRLAAEKGRRVLVLADRRRLVKQFGATLEGFGLRYGVIMAGQSGATREPIILASRDTLARWVARERDLQTPDLILIDEAHKSLATVYQAILERFPRAFVIGLTATPARHDGQSMGSFYHWLECTVPASRLIADGWLVKPEVYAPMELVERRRKGEPVKGLCGDPVTHWLEHARGLPTVGFAANVPEARALAARFTAAGIPADSISGEADDDPDWSGKSERDRVYDRLAAGEIKVLCSVGLLVEGVDIPEVSAAIIWSRFGSVVKWRQACGRTMRPCPRIGKTRSVILDHAGAAGEHGLPGDDVEWSLDLGSTVDGRREKAIEEGRQAATVVCQSCGLAYSGVPACPNCGRAAPRAERKRTMAEQYQASRDAILERFEPDQARDFLKERERRAWVSAICTAIKRGQKAAAASAIFKGVCKKWPEDAGVDPPPASRADRDRPAAEVWPQFVRQGAAK